jgi:thiol-disulfide isomerase/thioredoxin
VRIGIALSILALCSFGPSVVAQGPIIVAPTPKSSHKDSMKLLPVGETAPDWQLSDAEGNAHSLSEYRGKVVIMDFWATWCGPCAEVMPRMQKLHEKYADRGVVVFGVNSWEKSDPVALMQKKRFGYKLLLKGEEIAAAYKITILPVVYIIGDDGTIIYCHEGVDNKNLTSLIEKYLNQRRTAETP